MPWSRVTNDETDPLVRDRDYERTDDEMVSGSAWSPAQFYALIVGIGFIALGVAAVASTGLDNDTLYQPQDRVWGLWHSPLLGLIEIGVGVLMVVAGVVPGGLRTLMAFLGAAALAFGIVIFIDAARDDLHEWLGVTTRSGWFFTIVGAVTLIVAMVSPVIVPSARHRRVRHVRHTTA
jgi:hypothetical protein